MQETPVQSLGPKDPQRRKWQPTPVFLPEKLHGQRSLVAYSPWGCKESDTTEQLSTQHMHSLTCIGHKTSWTNLLPPGFVLPRNSGTLGSLRPELQLLCDGLIYTGGTAADLFPGSISCIKPSNKCFLGTFSVPGLVRGAEHASQIIMITGLPWWYSS